MYVASRRPIMWPRLVWTWNLLKCWSYRHVLPSLAFKKHFKIKKRQINYYTWGRLFETRSHYVALAGLELPM